MNDFVFIVVIGLIKTVYRGINLLGFCLCLEVRIVVVFLVGFVVSWRCFWRIDICINICNIYSMICKYILYVGFFILCISRIKGRIIFFICFLFFLIKKVYVYSVIYGIFLGLWRMYFWVCNWFYMINMKVGIYLFC